VLFVVVTVAFVAGKPSYFLEGRELVVLLVRKLLQLGWLNLLNLVSRMTIGDICLRRTSHGI